MIGTKSRLVNSVRILPIVVGVFVLLAAGMVPATADSELGEVQPTFETASNFDDEAGGDADADDPAIWRHVSSPGDSVVVGTLKNGGLTVFDLRGRELQRILTPPAPSPDTEAGRFNNVDIVQGAKVGNQIMDLAIVSDRGRDRIRTYAIDPRGAKAGAQVLTDVTSATPPIAFSSSEAAVEDQHTAYGLAVWADPAGGAPWVVVSQRSETRLGLFRLAADPAGKVTYTRAATVDMPRSFTVSGQQWSPCAEPGVEPQVEGMVVDRVSNVLYAGQEDVGIWRIPLSSQGFGTPKLVERVREYGQPAAYNEETEECEVTGPRSAEAGKYLSADVEGLSIAYQDDQRSLIASSQGDHTFAMYELAGTGLGFDGGTRIVASGALDGVQECDGAAVITTAFGPDFPQGLLVVQDGQNTPETIGSDGEPRPDTNFKLVRWDLFEDAAEDDD